MKEHLTFLQEVKRNFETTGAVLPSSAALARAVADEISPGRGGRNILEIGAGTGSCTRKILPRLAPSDRFVVYEMNDVLFGYLRSRLEGHGHWSKYADIVDLRNEAFPKGVEDGAYDILVSGLPLNNMPPPFVEEIFEAIFRCLKPGGKFVFYEYCFIRGLKRPFVSPRDAVRLRKIGRILEKTCKAHEVRRKTIFGNIPPAWVHVLIA